MNIKNILKNNAMVLIAFATITGFSVSKADTNESDGKVTVKAQDDLHWYVRDSNGQYSEFTPSPGQENVEDICPTPGPQICALGFESEMNPSELSDSDEANSADQRYKPAD
ncbi:hypothetical protein [Sphingobacterium pedocola]|uniref:Uncharacterized protein n=1 Tax=Sphingobacterium pedocola TaxID=2082722 RepID=A0ABR9T2T9_9SPHI|nr:hypothetical protein [Sphingobacterium pedocola]MBE8719661.1 hypothetical protein [Sphingobacterium pedocola]